MGETPSVAGAVRKNRARETARPGSISSGACLATNRQPTAPRLAVSCPLQLPFIPHSFSRFSTKAQTSRATTGCHYRMLPSSCQSCSKKRVIEIAVDLWQSPHGPLRTIEVMISRLPKTSRQQLLSADLSMISTCAGPRASSSHLLTHSSWNCPVALLAHC